MGALGYVPQLGGSYLAVDLVSRKCYHVIIAEHSWWPKESQGQVGVCGMQPGTTGGKRWVCCPGKGWRASIFISFAQRDKVGR